MIEQAIETLTAAVNRNNELLEKVIALSGTAPVTTAAAPAPEKTDKGKKDKAAKAETKPAPPLAALEDPDLGDEQPAADPAADESEPEGKTFASREAAILEITDFVKGVLSSAGQSLGAKKTQYEQIRAGFNVAKVTALAEDQLVPFWNAIQALKQ